MSYVLCIPELYHRGYSQFGRPVVERDDGFLKKVKITPGVHKWTSIKRIQDAHKWKTREKAESAAVFLSAKYPKLFGRLVLMEVEKHGSVWYRSKPTSSKS